MVTPFSGEGAKRFADGLESFLQEARTLARFDGSPNIVGVRDFFTENGTAYLVMNYLEGITLKQYLVRSGGKPCPQQDARNPAAGHGRPAHRCTPRACCTGTSAPTTSS